MSNEIWVVPFFGQGHLFPSIELCKRIASRNFKTLLVIPSHLSSSVPAGFRNAPLVGIIEIPSGQETGPRPLHPPGGHHQDLALGLEVILKAQLLGPNGVRPVCAVLDVMMDWTAEIVQKFEVPTVGFFTSGACSAAMEYATWKAQPIDVGPGEVRLLPGLPDEMGLTYLDTKQRPHAPPGLPPPGPFEGSFPPRPPPPFGNTGPGGVGPFEGSFPLRPPPPFGSTGPGGVGPFEGSFPLRPPPPFGSTGPGRVGPIEGFFPLGPPPPGPGGTGPPKLGDQPQWLEAIEKFEAIMINTCDDLESPFLDYLSNQIKKPVWGVGPLLPEKYWNSPASLIRDHEIRSNRPSNITEDEVIRWLDSKPPGSVLYVSFGSEVGPTLEEYSQLSEALEASNGPFIWVIQERSETPNPIGLGERVGSRGLIIQGWAPQLLILSHVSTGGFLSHCGWNSTVEAIGRGVPILAWPIRGDQQHNAKLVVAHLKVGFMVSGDLSEKIEKEDIVKGIESLMGHAEIKRRAELLAAKFHDGFPISSVAALDAFGDLIARKTA